MIVDDDALVRLAYKQYLQPVADIQVIEEATSAAEGLEILRKASPDVALVDMRMPGMGGGEFIRRARAQGSSARCIAVTTFGSTAAVRYAAEAGAHGFVVKDAGPDEVLAAIRRVATGHLAYGDHATRRLVEAMMAQASSPTPPASGAPDVTGLTDAQAKVVHLLARGMSNNEIASQLSLAEGTIKSHLNAVMRRWDVRDRVQIVLRALGMRTPPV